LPATQSAYHKLFLTVIDKIVQNHIFFEDDFQTHWQSGPSVMIPVRGVDVDG